ncbi:hypothetical protein FJV77_14230 [Mesorhizobium sp. WSM4306]|nr:hypothetical protein FJV77_14230 [Mesorhizobium sp. WSM4306]
MLRAPLCPAGHLPHEGGDQSSAGAAFLKWTDGDLRRRIGEAATLLISPLVGEMSGRTEGGAVPPASPPPITKR